LEAACSSPGGVGEAVEALRRAIGAHRLVVFLGTCSTSYEGRAASKSTPGDVVVMVKPDGAVIVHSPRGYKPQNWQPDTKAIAVEEAPGGRLVLKAVRSRPREVLVVECTRVNVIVEAEPREEPQHFMFASEQEIRDAIARNPALLEPGLRVITVEKPVEPGFIDLYARDGEGRLVVVELKRVKAGEAAVRQLISYARALEKRGYTGLRLVLAAPDFTEAARRLAAQAGVELARLDLRRIREEVEAARRRARSLEDYL